MSQPELDFSDRGVAGTDGSGHLDDGAPGDPLQPEGTYTVGQLADVINSRLRAGFDDGVWVRGEIQGWSSRGPHAYFSLADDRSETKAVIQVAFFAPQRERLRRLLDRHHLVLGDGMKVRIHGYLDFYAPTGRLTLKMGGIDPRFTLGDLAQQRDQVLRRLVAGGHLDRNRRHRLSPVPLRIGVVTSVGSAAWHDFEHELTASGVGFRLTVCDVRVQGERAVAMVAAGIERLTRCRLDAIVVIRGGGARNELAVFDAEPIAMAIAGAGIPVLTGLGHEVDRSVADEVAHTSFKTPTACAQFLVQTARAYLAGAERAYLATLDRTLERLAGAEARVADRAHRIARRTHAAVVRADERLSSRAGALRRGAGRHLGGAERRVGSAVDRLRSRPPQVLTAEQRHLDALAARARSLDPVVMLDRGWTITRSADGELLRTSAAIAPGEVIETQFADGRLRSTASGRTQEDP
jgi:exodeoxyribonuclease VII large subunit